MAVTDQQMQAFKQSLLSKGIDWSESQIKNYITLKQAGDDVSRNLAPINLNQQQIEQEAPNMGVFERFSQKPGLIVPQEEKSALYDFIGNFLWEGLDSATFGALGWMDPDEGGVEEFLTDEGPEGFAGRVGAGLGSFGGFLLPFGVTGKALGAVSAAGRYGAKAKSAGLLKEGSKYLAREAGDAKKGYKAFRKLSENKRKDFFKPFSDDIVELGPKVSNKLVREAYTARFSVNLRKEVSKRLKDHGIKPTNNNLNRIEEIIQKAAGVSGNSSLPIATLEGRIALALGGASTPIASMAATALAEGLTFAAVETPFEIFQSMEEGRDMDMPGRWGHAFVLGNALGLIKYVPGGLSWKDGSITKTAWKKMRDSFNTKKPYHSYDVNSKDAREQLVIFAKGIYSRTGSRLFKDKMKGLAVNSKTDISTLGQTPEGAKKLITVLQSIEKDFERRWAPEFFKGMSQDLVGSTPRMLMGAMAFNYEMVFDDRIPLEDKIFHTLLGAWMTKRGRVLEYTNSEGGLSKVNITDTKPVGGDFETINDYLKVLKMDPQLYNWKAAVNAEVLMKRHMQNIEENNDVVKLKEILDNNKVVVVDDGTESRKPKNAGEEGMNPIYEYLQSIYDFTIGSKNGTRMLSPNRVTQKQIKAIEKALKEHDFASIVKDGGIENPAHIDDIFYAASDKNMKHLIDTHIDAAIGIHNHLAGGENGIIRSTEKNTLTRLYHIVQKPSGAKLSAENKVLLERYERIINALNGRHLFIGKEPGSRLQVTNENFKGLKEIVDRYEAEVNKIIYGEETQTLHTQSTELMQEGFIYELIRGQDFYKGVRDIYRKLNDLSNQAESWKLNGEKPHDGENLSNLISDLLMDNNGFLAAHLEFSKNVPHELQQMLTLFHQLLSVDPNTSAPIFEQQGTTLKIDNLNQLKEMRRLLMENGMVGFMNENLTDRQIFLNEYQKHAFERFTHGAIKRDGAPLNANDRAALSQLMDLGLLGPNFQLVEVVGVVNHIEQVIDMAGLRLEGGKLLNADGTMFKITDIKQFTQSDAPESLKEFIRETANETGIIPTEQLELILKSYKDFIEPFMVDDKGNGFIKKSEIIAQVRPHQIIDFVSKLDTVYKMRERQFHDNLLEKLEMMKNGQEYTKDDREKISYLYYLYASGVHSTSKIIKALHDRGLYNFKEDKADLDATDKSLGNKLQEIIKEVEWEIAQAGDATKIENNINTYRSGRDAKISETEVYRTISKQTLINDYNLDKNVDLKKDDVAEIVANAYIVKNGEKHFFIEERGDNQMDYKERQKFILELNKVIGGVTETRTLTRLFGTEGYGIHTQSDYQVYNNHFFDFLDLLVGKDGFAVVDYDLMRTNNRIESSRVSSKAKNILYNLLNDSRTHIDKNLRKDDYGTLIYEQRDTGSLVIEVPGLQYAISISKDKLPGIFERIRQNLDDSKSKYDAGKFKPIFKELERKFETLTKQVKKTRDIEVKEDGEVKIVQEEYFEYEYKEQSADNAGLALESLMQSMYLDNWLKDLYWEDLSINVNNGDPLVGAGLLRRIKLFANTSMRRQSEGQLDVSLALYKKYLNPKDSQYKALQKLKKKGGMEIVIARDERFDGEGRQFSIIKELQEQLAEAKNNAKDIDKEGIEHMENLIKTNDQGELEFAGGGDISKVDSYMAVSNSTMEALYTLNGASYMQGMGGIKPIIHRVGQAIILGKTAFIRDPRLDSFFKKNDVDAVLFDSGVKMKAGNTKIFEDFASFDDLATKDVRDYKELLKLEDFSLGSVVNSEHSATISYQATNHLNATESKDMFNWLLNEKLNNLVNESEVLFNAQDPLHGISMAKFLAEKNGSIDPNSLYSRWIANNGFIHSQLIMPDFINQIKNSRIDNGGIMKMKTIYGNQSVNSPGEGLRFTLFKNDSETGQNEVWQYGEADLPYVAGNKPIALDRLHLIDRKVNEKDALISAKDVVGQDIEIYKILKEVHMMKDTAQLDRAGNPRDVWVVTNISQAKRQLAQIKKGKGKGKNFTTIKKISDGYYVLNHKRGDHKHIYIEDSKAHTDIEANLVDDAARTWTGEDFMYTKKGKFEDGMTLHQAMQVAIDINQQTGKNYAIAATFRRNPGTRPGDIAIVGIRDILGSDYGNQVKLNALDFSLRLEGDYDVDKTDFWWDTPTSILNKWSSLSGKILRVNTDKLNKKSSLVQESAVGADKPLDLLDAASVRNWDRNLAESERLRGTVIKTQRLLQALTHYSSHKNILKTKEWADIQGLSLNLEGAKGGGMLYINPKKLERAYEVLATDIQNITDSLTGYDVKKYNDKWFENFLFGDDSGNYDGIFSKGSYDKNKQIWIPATDQKWTPTAIEKRLIAEVIKPYRAMLQLGTQLYSNGKAEPVKYENILSQMREFDAFYSNLNRNVYWKLRKEGDKRGFSLDQLEGFFKDKQGKWVDVFGEFPNLIRPNLFGRAGDKPLTQFTDMLPFERTMSVLAYNDNMSLNMPGYLGGEMLQRYHDFYSKYMHSEDFNTAASQLINDINKNDKTFGYINYLDWRIKSQQTALRDARGNKHTQLAEVITESLNNLKEQKESLEDNLLYSSTTEGMEFARKLRDGAIQNLINSVYKGKMLPKKWNQFAGTRKDPLAKDERWRTFNSKEEVNAFVNSNFPKFVNYIKRAGIVRLKGVHSPEQLELLIFHNMWEKYQQIGIRDAVSGEEMLDLDKDVVDTGDFYRNIWKKHFTGGDWTMDSKRVNSLVIDMLETKFMKWEKQAGAGQLFLWKLMSPKTDPYNYTYFNRRISPAFKSESLSLIKLGLRFINNADNKIITDFQKKNLFAYITDWYNSSYRAAYGQPGEAGFTLTRQLSNMSNMRTDIYKGAPLVDDIRGWRPGYQETELNPQLKHLFGNDPRSIAHVFASSALDPSVVKDAVNISTWAYNPITYIPENITLMNYPTINGYKNFKEALSNSSNIMLGSSINQRLLFRKAPIIERQAHENIQPNEPTGSESMNQRIDAKVKVFC